MTREELAQLYSEIAGGSGFIGEEALRSRKEAETAVGESILRNYWGQIYFGDAYHQFYTDTLREIGKHFSAQAPRLLQHFFIWHVVSANRHYAIFDLFRRGYYYEAISLARSLWETALTMAALNKGLVTLEDVYGGTSISGKKIDEREMKTRVEETDRKIQKNLIWKNSALNEASRKAVNVFLNILNQSTHKSNLAVVMTVKYAEEAEAVPLFPQFYKSEIEITGNIITLVTWSMMLTLNYFGDLLPGESSPWRARYQKAIVVFNELNKNPPNPVLAGFGDIMAKVFV